MVFAVAFTDGSSPYVQKEDGEGIYYDDSVDLDEIALRSDKYDIRQD